MLRLPPLPASPAPSPAEAVGTVPHIIHFIWIGSALPDKYAFNIQTFRDKNPGFEVMVHDDAALRTLMHSRFPDTLARYESAVNYPQKKDFASFVVVYVYGGVFFDCDLQCLKGLSPVVDKLTLLAVQHVADSGLATLEQGPSLSVFGAIAAHPVIGATITAMASVHKPHHVTPYSYIQAVATKWSKTFKELFPVYLSTPLQYGLQPGSKFGFLPTWRFVGSMMAPTPDMYTYLAGAQGSWHSPLQRFYHQVAAAIYTNKTTVLFVIVIFTLLAVLVLLVLTACGLSCCTRGGKCSANIK